MGVKKYLQNLGTREDTSKKIIAMNNEVPAVYMQYASYRVFSLEDMGNPLQEYPTPEPSVQYNIYRISLPRMLSQSANEHIFHYTCF
jgi:hypothetical protein